MADEVAKRVRVEPDEISWAVIWMHQTSMRHADGYSVHVVARRRRFLARGDALRFARNLRDGLERPSLGEAVGTLASLTPPTAARRLLDHAEADDAV